MELLQIIAVGICGIVLLAVTLYDAGVIGFVQEFIKEFRHRS